MKKIKSILIASAIIALVGTLFAFNVIKDNKKEKLFADACWVLKPGVDPGDVTAVRNPANWQKITCGTTPCSDIKEVICYLRLVYDANHVYNFGTASETPKVDQNFNPTTDQLSNDLGTALSTPTEIVKTGLYEIRLTERP